MTFSETLNKTIAIFVTIMTKKFRVVEIVGATLIERIDTRDY